MDHIFYICKIARLGPVSVDRRVFVIQYAGDELWHYDGILVLEALPGAEYIEIPQVYRLEAIDMAEEPAVRFCRELG